MRLSDIIKKILLELSTEIKKEENMIILRSDILNPIIKEIIDELINVDIVWEPQWDQSMMTEAAKLQLGMM